MSSSRCSSYARLVLVGVFVFGSACGAADETDPLPATDASGLQAALDLQEVFANVAEQTFPSVAGISAYRSAPGKVADKRDLGWREASRDGHPGFDRIGQGSAFVVSDQGFLLTAHSLLRDVKTGRMADRIEVELGDERLEGRLVGAEPSINLAVLKVEHRGAFQPVTIGDSNSAAVGHWAIAIGDPPGPGTVFATGSISAVPERECYQEQRSATLLRSSAQVPAGAVGGPLLNIYGEVIGISLPQQFRGWSDFALPMELAMTLYEPLLVRESIRSPWIGVSVQTRGSERPLDGLLIDDVFDPSPASRADIRVGDVLLYLGPDKVATVGDFQRWLYLNGIGATVEIKIWREFEISKRTITIEERPASAKMR